MATMPSPPHRLAAGPDIDYPTGDGQPVGETPIHRDNLFTAVKTLDRHFAHQPLVYVSGNMFVYYEKGNRHKHVAPDVFVAVGVPKNRPRDAYFIWEEDHGLDFVVELTSKTTRDEDLIDKMSIYRDDMPMPVPEYFLFDPKGEYLDPPLQGYRLREREYIRIEMVEGRLPSEVLSLHLDRDGEWLRFYDPASGHRLPTPDELLLEEQTKREQAEAEREQAEAEREQAEAERERAEAERERAEAERERLSAELRKGEEERERLRQELDEWRRRFGGQSASGPSTAEH
jgi:Uma2 family endonuclease